MFYIFKKILLIFLIFSLNSFTPAQATAQFEHLFDISGNRDTGGNNGSRGLTFNTDGTKMFVIGWGDTDSKVNEYTLSIAYDINSTVLLNASHDVIAHEGRAMNLKFNTDGTKMFVIGDGQDFVREYSLAEGFNLSTASVAPVNSYSVAVEETKPYGLDFNSDGTMMYVTGNNSDSILQYSLSVGFDLSSTINLVRSNNLRVLMERNPLELSGIEFNANGTRLFIIDTRDNGVDEYALSVGFDISTITHVGFLALSDEEANPSGIAFNNTGTKMFITGNIGDEVNEYSLSCPYKVTSSSTCDTSELEEEGGAEDSEAPAPLPDPTKDKDVIGLIDSTRRLAKETISNATDSISNRLSNIRCGFNQSMSEEDLCIDNSNQSSQNIKLDFGNAILTSLTNDLLAKNDKSLLPDNWSSWSEGSISVTKIGDSTNSSSKEIDSHGLALGFDTKLNNNDTLGFAIQYGQSDADVGSNGTNSDSENYNLSVYRTRSLDDNQFIEGIFGVGAIESDLTRVSGANTLTGSRDGTQVYGSVNYGKKIDKGDFSLTPIGRVDLGYTELDSYNETGINALSYDKQTIESGLASFGVEIDNIIKFLNSSLKPFGSLEYGLDFSNSSDAKINYVSDTSTTYTHTQGSNSNHLITSVIGFEFMTEDNLNILTSYKRIQGDESEHTDMVNVSLNFKSKQETNYAMSLDGSDDLKAGFDITKNVNGFDLSFNADQSLNENSDQTAEVSLSRKF
jgi:hypothetical protein